ncbi:MAG: Sec-independent protein translocase subunit TatA/TatB, partial [Actinomycetota bacterium]
ALIVFGPKKLPEIGKGIGKALRESNKARNDSMDTLNTDIVEDDEPSYKASSSYTESSTTSLPEPEGAVAAGRKVEYPQTLDADSADALPYGGSFHAVEGDSQPSFRTAEPDAPAASAAHASVDHADSAAHPLGMAEGKV